MGGLGESGCGDAGINWKEERDGKEGGGAMPPTENEPQILNVQLGTHYLS